MNVFLALIPIVLIVALYWWGFRRFKSKHGQEVPGPQGQTPFGVHGLLAFFIFASYYIGPLFALGSTNSTFLKLETQYPVLLSLPGYSSYKIGTFILVLAVIVWQIMVARQLRWKLEPSSLKNARILCVGVPFIFIVADIILGKATLNVLPDGDAVRSYIGSILMSSIWASYFFISKRCKNTYFSNSNNSDTAEEIVAPPDITFNKEPIGAESNELAQRLIKLQELKHAGLITEQEYETKRQDILSAV